MPLTFYSLLMYNWPPRVLDSLAAGVPVKRVCCRRRLEEPLHREMMMQFMSE